MGRREGQDDGLERLMQEWKVGEEHRPLIEAAVTHRSWWNEKRAGDPTAQAGDNERLEFLGDAVLGVVMAKALYQRLPDRPEGDLSKAKAQLVSTEALARHARRLDLGRVLRLGRGEERSGGRERDSLLADTFEALLGAVFLGEGLKTAERVILRTWDEEITVQTLAPGERDAKSVLQEYTQKHHGQLPVYRLERTEGPDHSRLYEIAVMVGETIYGTGRGKSKKEAAQDAAAKALLRLRQEKDK